MATPAESRVTSHGTSRPMRVVVAGAGVAGLEALLAIRDLAGDRVDLTLLAPDDEFVYHPLGVYQAFADEPPRRYPLTGLLQSAEVEQHRDSFRWLDPHARVVHTEAGEQLRYDALLLALGARRQPRFTHAVTIDDIQLAAQVQPLVEEMADAQPRSVVMVIPSLPTWPLPIYELALMTAGRARSLGRTWTITVVTPEGSPLQVFGEPVSDAVGAALAHAGIQVVTGQTAQMHEPHIVSLHPSAQRLEADDVYVLPELYGPSVPGVPTHAERGFISVDQHGAVAGLEGVYAAGDAVDFPLKFGGISAQQADTAARSIAALAGAPVSQTPQQMTIRGVLLGGEEPIYMQAQVSYLHGIRSQVGTLPVWEPSEKISARYLSDYLESQDEDQSVMPSP